MKQLWAGVVLAMTAAGFGTLHVPAIAHADDGDVRVVVDDPKLVGARDDARREHARRTDAATTTARVLVEVDTADTEGVARGLRRIGAIVSGSVPGSVVQALVPVDSLEAVAAFGAVSDLKYPRRQGYVPNTPLRRTDLLSRPQSGTGPTHGGAVEFTTADFWQGVGFTGAGVKVGIVDYFSPNIWSTAEQGTKPDASHQFCKDSFSAPGSANSLCTVTGAIANSGEIHGNAVAEIVKDMAPGAELYIATVGTVTDLKAAIDWFAASGVTIMTRSLGSAYDGPGDGSGPLGNTVNYAVAKGITWFNSAGNEGEDQYMKKVVKATVAVDGGNFVNVNDGSPVASPAVDTWLRVDSYGSSGCFFMDGVRWANDWNLPAKQRTDYSIEFWQPKATFSPGDVTSHRNPTLAQVDPINLNALGFGDQHGTGSGRNVINRSQYQGVAPFEAADIAVCPSRMSNLTEGTYVTYIRIKRNAVTPVGTVPDKLEVAIAGPGLFEYTYSDRAGSAAKPVVDSKNPALVSVGAVEMQPELRIVPSDPAGIAWYSSQGPTTDGRVKPDVASWAGGYSWTYATYDPPSLGQFSGTSAATPATAGLAALMAGAHLAGTPAALAALVKHQTNDHAPLGPDNAYGFGLTSLLDPPSRPAEAASPGRYVPVSPKRLFDSRPKKGGPPAYSRALGSIIDIPLGTLSGINPGLMGAVAVNITSVGSRSPGFVQAFPTNQSAFGTTSTLNINTVGETVANFAIVPVGDAGSISLYMPAGGHVIVDLMGYFTKNEVAPTDGRFVPLTTPSQVFSGTLFTGTALDQRVTLGAPFTDLVPSGQAEAAVVSITAWGANRTGYIRAAPAGVDATTLQHSSLNFVKGSQVTNMAIVPLGAGSIQLYMPAGKSSTGTLLPVGAQVKVDVIGYITSASAPALSTGTFMPIAPTRMFDSRRPAGNPPVSGQTTVTVGGVNDIVGDPGAPAGAIAYSGNLTVTQPTAAGVLSVVAGGSTATGTVNVSYAAGRTIASGALFPVTTVPGVPSPDADTTTVNAFMSATGHVIIDINGYFLP